MSDGEWPVRYDTLYGPSMVPYVQWAKEAVWYDGDDFDENSDATHFPAKFRTIGTPHVFRCVTRHASALTSQEVSTAIFTLMHSCSTIFHDLHCHRTGFTAIARAWRASLELDNPHSAQGASHELHRHRRRTSSAAVESAPPPPPSHKLHHHSGHTGSTAIAVALAPLPSKVLHRHRRHTGLTCISGAWRGWLDQEHLRSSTTIERAPRPSRELHTHRTSFRAILPARRPQNKYHWLEKGKC
jgi:hypothetical protein